MQAKQKTKRFDFTVSGHYFSYYYDDVKELISHIFERATKKDAVYEICDCFAIARCLGEKNLGSKNA